MKGFINRLVNGCVLCVEYSGSLASLFIDTLRCIFIPPFRRERTFEQAKMVGNDSLFIVSLVAFFMGMILAIQTAYLMQKLSSEIYIANIVAISLVRELAPVLTALIVAGRVGAAITAEIGTMKVTEQIDALKSLATNPVKYLVVPRFLALTIMLPLLTVYADLIGILGGYIIGVYKLSISSSMYMTMTFQYLEFKDLFTGLAKTVVFGMIIAIVACWEGLNVKGGAEGVGKSTTMSVVKTFILIIASDCLITALFYFVLGQ